VDSPRPFGVSLKPGSLRAFGALHVDADQSVDVEWTFADADDDWTLLVDLTALGPLVGSLSDAARADLRTP
jgi:hypothetical protein